MKTIFLILIFGMLIPSCTLNNTCCQEWDGTETIKEDGTSPKDVEQSKTVLKELKKKYDIQEKENDIYFSTGPGYNLIIINGISDMEEQSKICCTLLEIKQRNQFNPIIIKFYKRGIKRISGVNYEEGIFLLKDFEHWDEDLEKTMIIN